MATRQTLVQAFDHHWGAWQRGVTACRHDPTRRAVHDLRVQCRRLLALLELVRHVTGTPHGARHRLRDAVRRALDDLSPLRDAQVQRRRVAHARPGPGIDELVQYLRRRVTRQERRTSRGLHDADRPRVLDAAARVREAMASRKQPISARERDLRIAAAVDAAAGEVRTRLGGLDKTRLRTVHGLRISLKRFRYTAEIAERLAPTMEIPVQATLRALQRRLGDVHDAEVLIERLDRFATKHPERAGSGIEALRVVLEHDRDRHLTGLARAVSPLRRALTTVAARAAKPPAPAAPATPATHDGEPT